MWPSLVPALTVRAFTMSYVVAATGVLLLDKGDFACGTSQASAMMVWGGLLYLRNFDIKAVVEFSPVAGPDDRAAGWQSVRKQSFRYIPDSKEAEPMDDPVGVLSLLDFKFAKGREQPSLQRSFPESNLINLPNIIWAASCLRRAC